MIRFMSLHRDSTITLLIESPRWLTGWERYKNSGTIGVLWILGRGYERTWRRITLVPWRWHRIS